MTRDPALPAGESGRASSAGAGPTRRAAGSADPMLAARLDDVEAILRDLRSVLVAYSGGVDSSLLARLAHDVLGPRAIACIAVSPSLASDELEAAVAVAGSIGIRLVRVETHEVELEAYARNPVNRCYVCRGVVFEALAAVAAAEGIDAIVYGENADDAADYRPGARAAVQAGVRAPLAEAGLTKADVRALARVLGLPTWEKPAAPCLSTRIPYGERVTVEKLRQIEAAERVVRGLGFRESRVRHHGEIARVEVSPDQLARAIEPGVRATMTRELRRLGFRHVTLDLQGYRSGSLNEGVVQPDRAGRRSPLAAFVTPQAATPDGAVRPPSAPGREATDG